MAGSTVLFCHRLMAELGRADLFFDVAMTVKTDLTRPALDQPRLVGTMGAMTKQAIAVGERHVSRFFAGLQLQVTMATQADGTTGSGLDQQALMFTPVGSMTTGTVALRKGTVLAEQSHLTTGLAMAGETQIGLLFHQQISLFGFMGCMAIQTHAVF
jgi:hypothetical protein